jgi:hypothetical protein
MFWSDEGFRGYSWNGFADLSVLRTYGINGFMSITAAFLHGYLVFFCHRAKITRIKKNPRAGSSK